MTIVELLNADSIELTLSERKLSSVLMENYPVSGMGSITDIAQRAGVSTPTVIRLVRKLGFKGFPSFQAELRKELEAKILNPITKRDTWAENESGDHILNRFADAVIKNIAQTLGQIDSKDFNSASSLMADTNHSLFITGGRITRTIADYLYLHMQVIRKDVTLIQPISNAWPHYLLDLEKGDVLVIFDVRRYENSILKLAKFAAEREAVIILLTDQWRSPIEKYATYCFSNMIAAPSAWDSSVAPLLLVETFIAAVQDLNWAKTKDRMEQIEDMFDRTGFFRKFT